MTSLFRGISFGTTLTDENKSRATRQEIHSDITVILSLS